MKKLSIFLTTMFLGFIITSAFAAKTVTIATGEYAPYTSKSMKDYGFAAKITTEAFKAVGYNVKYVFVPWKRCEVMIQKNQAFGTIPYAITPERKKKYYFSTPFTPNTPVIFYYKKNPLKGKFTSLNQLKGLKIGGHLGYYYEPVLKSIGTKIHFSEKPENALKMLKAGRIQLYPGNELVVKSNIKKYLPNDYDNFKVIRDPKELLGASSNTALMISKKYPQNKTILSDFNKGLKIIKANGTYRKILRQYGLK